MDSLFLYLVILICEGLGEGEEAYETYKIQMEQWSVSSCPVLTAKGDGKVIEDWEEMCSLRDW